MNITVNYVVESLCTVFCACIKHVLNGASPPCQLSLLVHLQPFVQLYVVKLCLFYVYLRYLIKNAFGYVNRAFIESFSLPVLIFSTAHAAQTAAHNY